MAKNLFLVTMAAKISVLIEAKDEKEAKAAGAGQAAEVFGKSFGILTVVGDAKALALAEGKASKAKVDDEEEEEEDDDEEKPAKSKKGKKDEKAGKTKIKLKLKS